jgi:hypothetical protein
MKLTEDRVIFLVDLAFKYGPDAARAVKALFDKADPTEADWDGVFAQAKKSYDSYLLDAEAAFEGG